MEGQLDLQNLTLCCHTHSHDSGLINPPLPPALTVVVGSSWSPCFFFLTPSVWSLRQLVSSHSEWKPSLHREQETLQDTATTSPPWPHLLPSPLCSLLSMQTPLFAVPGAHCACSHLGTRAMGCFLCLVSFSPQTSPRLAPSIHSGLCNITLAMRPSLTTLLNVTTSPQAPLSSSTRSFVSIFNSTSKLPTYYVTYCDVITRLLCLLFIVCVSLMADY